MESTRQFDQELVNRLSGLLYSENSEIAEMVLSVKKGASNSVFIRMKGDRVPDKTKGSLFAKIKSKGEDKYFNFKDIYKDLFDEIGITYSANNNEFLSAMIRINYDDLIGYIDTPDDAFIKLINQIFRNTITRCYKI